MNIFLLVKFVHYFRFEKSSGGNLKLSLFSALPPQLQQILNFKDPCQYKLLLFYPYFLKVFFPQWRISSYTTTDTISTHRNTELSLQYLILSYWNILYHVRFKLMWNKYNLVQLISSKPYPEKQILNSWCILHVCVIL